MATRRRARRRFGRVREFTPGAGSTLIDTPAGHAGVVICNEGFLPEPAAERVRRGAAVLVNLANDSWLQDPKFSEPAFDMVTLRAVEQRRWLVRASTGGPSALVAPVGRVVAGTALGTDGPQRDGVAATGRDRLLPHRGRVRRGCLLVALGAMAGVRRVHVVPAAREAASPANPLRETQS